MTDTRCPPWSEDAETAVLGAVLLDERAILSALEIISDGDFYAERHRRLFRAMVSLAECGSKIDPLTLANELQKRGELDTSGGKDYIGMTMDSVPFATNITDHARIIREKSDLRRLIERASSAMHAAFEAERPASEIAAELQRDVLGLSVDSAKFGFVRVKDDLWSVMEDLETRARGGGSRRVVPTGYREIDTRISGGFERGHFIVFAGTPGSGKTAAALNIMLNVSTADQPIGAAFVSAEMTRAQVITRSLARLGQINLTALRSGTLHGDDYPRLARAGGMLSSAALWVDETATPDIGGVLAKCRKLKAENPDLGLLVVDYIQLVQKRMAAQGGRRLDANRSAELTDISYTLQGLGKELDVAVLATSQVDASSIEKREDKRPTLGDARWSQGMREAAHLFATVFRPKMYDPDAFDTIELAFQKGRDDPPFTATFDWQGHFMRMCSRPLL